MSNQINAKNAQTIKTPGNSTTIKRGDNTYNLNNRNNSACSMNSTKQLINNEILKKKYSMPYSKETTLSNLLTKNAPLHLNQINNKFPGPLSQRLLKKTENLKVIDDLYKLPKPELGNQKSEFSLEKVKGNALNEQEKSNFNKLQSTEKKKALESKEMERALISLFISQIY